MSVPLAAGLNYGRLEGGGHTKRRGTANDATEWSTHSAQWEPEDNRQNESTTRWIVSWWVATQCWSHIYSLYNSMINSTRRSKFDSKFNLKLIYDGEWWDTQDIVCQWDLCPFETSPALLVLFCFYFGALNSVITAPGKAEWSISELLFRQLVSADGVK